MRIEPSYVLESPRPAPWSRRRLLQVGVAALAGAGLGAAWIGPVLGGARGVRAQHQDGSDPTLDWLLGLCAPEAPLTGLLAHHEAVLYLVPRAYPEQASLWQGIERLARAALEQQDLPAREELVRDLSECLATHARSAGRAELLALVPPLVELDTANRRPVRAGEPR